MSVQAGRALLVKDDCHIGVNDIKSTVVGRHKCAESFIVNEPGSDVKRHLCVHNGSLVL